MSEPGERTALGSDPFEADHENDPFLDGLERLGLEPRRQRFDLQGLEGQHEIEIVRV